MTGRYSICNSSIDFEKLLARIDIPVLFITLVNDFLVTAKCAQFLASKLKVASVTRIELDAADYNLKIFDHFNWVKNPAPIIKNVQNWLSKHYELSCKHVLCQTHPFSVESAPGEGSSFTITLPKNPRHFAGTYPADMSSTVVGKSIKI